MGLTNTVNSKTSWQEPTWEERVERAIRYLREYPREARRGQSFDVEKLVKEPAGIVTIVEASTKAETLRAGEEFCFALLQAVVAIIGNRTSALSDEQKSSVRKLYSLAGSQPYPVLPIARFVVMHLENLRFLKEGVGRLLDDKTDLLAAIETIEISTQLGEGFWVSRPTRALVHGYSVLIPKILRAFKGTLEADLTITLVDCGELGELHKKDAQLTRQELADTGINQISFLAPAEAMRTLDDTHILVVGVNAIGIYDGELCVISNPSVHDFCERAKGLGKPILVVGGRYKMWPQDVFEEYAETIKAGNRSGAILRANIGNWWIATESGVLSSDVCKAIYEQFLTAQMERYLLWERGPARQREASTPTIDSPVSDLPQESGEQDLRNTIGSVREETRNGQQALEQQLTAWTEVTTALKAVAHSTDTMQGALSALDTKVDELRLKVDAITQRNDAMEKLEKRTDSYRTEIAQADAGNRISAVQLRRYDPARFQVAWFPGEAFDKVVQYLRDEHHPYLRVGEDDRVLLSRTLLETLEGKFRTRSANIEDLFGGDIRYNHEVTARDDKAFLTLHRALEAYGPVKVSRRGEHYRFLLDERQYQHLKQNKVSGNWTYDSD